jgi:hypothetical protein
MGAERMALANMVRYGRYRRLIEPPNKPLSFMGFLMGYGVAETDEQVAAVFDDGE